MEILEAFDATGSYRAAGQLAGCSHHTVAAYVAARDAGRPVGAAARRPRVIDEFLPKVEELVEKTKGKVRADKVHEVLTSIGVQVTWSADKSELELIRPETLDLASLDVEAARRTRSVIMFLGPLLHLLHGRVSLWPAAIAQASHSSTTARAMGRSLATSSASPAPSTRSSANFITPALWVQA